MPITLTDVTILWKKSAIAIVDVPIKWNGVIESIIQWIGNIRQRPVKYLCNKIYDCHEMRTNALQIAEKRVMCCWV